MGLDGHASLWRRAKAVIRDMIVTELRPGDFIPSEAELCKRFGVSRVTIRQAITSLVYEGYLMRLQGRGTMVMPPKHEMQLAPSLGTLLAEPTEASPGLERRILSKETQPADKRLSARLHLPQSCLVHKIRMLYVSGGEPVGEHVSYVPRDICPDLLEYDLEIQSLYSVLTGVLKRAPSHAEETIECIMADERRANRLKILPGSPVILVQRLMFLEAGNLMEYRRTFYRTDCYRLRRILGPEGEKVPGRSPFQQYEGVEG